MCDCNCQDCGCENVANDPAHESLASSLNNFVLSFFGTVTKSLDSAGNVVWTLPCNLDVGAPAFPRIAGEGLACYFLRWILQAPYVVGGLRGYFANTSTSGSKILYRFINHINQNFAATLTGDYTLYLTANQAVNGDEFYISFTNLITSATKRFFVYSDGTLLLTFNTVGTLNGELHAVYTGSIWKITRNATVYT